MCLTNHSVSFTKTFSNLLRLILNTMNYQVPDLQGHKFFLLPPNNMYLPKKKNIYIEKKKIHILQVTMYICSHCIKRFFVEC